MANNCSGQTDKCEDKISLFSTQDRNIDSNYVSKFTVSKINCLSEECMVRMSLKNIRLGVALELAIPSRN
jgi:hypothetical protein